LRNRPVDIYYKIVIDFSDSRTIFLFKVATVVVPRGYQGLVRSALALRFRAIDTFCV
jgi:hypothetical protein